MTRALLVLLLLSACGEEPRTHDGEYRDHDIGVIRQGLTVGGAGGCDTSIVSGLTGQLVDELNCISPNSMADFRQSNITITSAVQPYLAPAAANALQAAVNAQGSTIEISSAYRSLAQQYLLYKWWQAGQCGIQAAAVPGSSNHQSGRAIDVPSYNSWMSALTNQGWTWFGSGDVVHFDYLSAPNLGGSSILAFQRVWNKNNAGNLLVEDGAWGPNTENALSQSPTTGFAVYGCAPADGTLKGTVYAVNPANVGDHSQLLAGVAIVAGGKHATTDANGAFSLALAPGSYMVTASLAGYLDATSSKAVQSSQTTTVELGLKTMGMPDTTPPEIAVGSPLPGSSVDAAQLTIQGTASDDQGPLAKVSLSVNGAAAQDVAVSAGAFSVMVQLIPGGNTLHFAAKDAAGNTGTLDVTLTFRAGIGGTVTDENGAPVVGAQIGLLDGNGHAVASVQTQSDGTYAIDYDTVPFEGSLSAQASGYVDYHRAVSLSADARTELSFALAHGQSGPGLRLIDPRDGETVLTPSLVVSGQADGFVPQKVTLNGKPAQLGENGGFSGTVELRIGDNVIEAVADDAFSTRVTVTLVDAQAWTSANRVRGGCAAAPGLMVPLVLLGLFRKRALSHGRGCPKGG